MAHVISGAELFHQQQQQQQQMKHAAIAAQEDEEFAFLLLLGSPGSAAGAECEIPPSRDHKSEGSTDVHWP